MNWFAIILILIGNITLVLGVRELYAPKGGLIDKAKVVEAFKGMDWTKQSFNYGGQQIKDLNGNTLFYPAETIDERIKKLNEVLGGAEGGKE